MVTWLFKNFAVCRDAARRAGLSATAELLVSLIVTASLHFLNLWHAKLIVSNNWMNCHIVYWTYGK